MIKREHYMTRADGVSLYITYSDAGYKIQQSPTGAIYDSAVDVETASYTYTETNEPVEIAVDPEYHEPSLQAQDALNTIFGGDS